MGTGTSKGSGAKAYIVDMSKAFAEIYVRLPANAADFVDEFIGHFEQHGEAGLPGRFKASHHVPTDDPLWLKKVKFAQAYNLHHYHVGYPEYDTARERGDWTSKYVLHVTLTPCRTETRLVGWGPHPPFILPQADDLLV